MKRIYLLLLLTVAMTSAAFAGSRPINLNVTLASPTSSTVVTWGGSFNVDAIIKNTGTDSLRYTDSVLWFMSISNQLISLDLTGSGQASPYWLRFHQTLKTNDTFHVHINGLKLTSPQTVDSNRTLCFYAYPLSGPTPDTIAEANTADNKACATFMFNKNAFPASVGNVTNAGTVVSVYPNPANAVLNFNVNTVETAEIKVEIMDLSGRVVLQSNQGTMAPGAHTIPLDTKSLQNGFYLYRVYSGGELSAGKIMIDK